MAVLASNGLVEEWSAKAVGVWSFPVGMGEVSHLWRGVAGKEDPSKERVFFFRLRRSSLRMRRMSTDSDLWRRLPESIRTSVLNVIDDAVTRLGETRQGESVTDIEFRKDTRTGLSIAAGALIELATGRPRGFTIVKNREGNG